MNANYLIRKLFSSIRYMVLFLLIIATFIFVGVGSVLLYARAHTVPAIKTGKAYLDGNDANATLGGTAAQKLTVNAQLQVNGQLYLSPTDIPTKGVAGQLLFDKKTNTLQYFDGTKFVSIAATVQQTTTTVTGGVSSLQGQTGAVSLVSGNGIAVSGTTITNNGILDIISAPNGIGVSKTGGVATLSLPQGLNVTASPTFAGLTVSGGALAVNTLSHTANGQDITIDAGNDALTIQAYGRTYQLPNTGPANQTICTTGISCVAGGGQSVMLAPGGAQTDNTGDVSIFINDTGGGNLLQLQNGGTNRFVVASNGDTTVGGILTANTITPTSTFTVGAFAQQFGLQGTSASTISARNGASTTTVAFVTPTANTTLSFPALSAGSYQVCTTNGNCLGSGGGANASLSNLSAVAINTSLLPGSTTIDLGSAANPFRDVYVGGTATNNFRVTGTASAARTITLPDASGTVAVSASGNIALSVNGNITFTGQLAVGSGGTGSTTAGGARVNLGAAASGANSDITSITGLTTALGVGYGGTGTDSFSQYALLVGNGTGALNETAVPGSAGLCLLSNLASAPSFQACPSGTPSTVTTSSSGTTNKLSKFTGVNTIADSSITDTGSLVTIANPLTVTGTVTASTIASTGALTITPASTFTAGATNQQFILQGNSASQITATSGSFKTTFGFTTPTANRTINLPDESGTVCLQGSANCGFASSGSGVTSLNSQTGSVSIANASGSGGVVTINNAAADGSTKGIAAFNSTNFSAASGVINTIQGISTSSSPQFASITLGTAGVVNANNILHTANGQGLSISSAADAITFTAGGINFIFPTTGPGSQTICTTGISCVAGGGQAVLLAPGTAQTDSSTDASIFINKTANGNIVQLQNSGTNVLTITRAGVMSVNTIAPISGTFTLGSAANPLTLQGDGTSSISATTGSGVTVVGFTGTAPTGTVRYNFDRNPTGGAGTYTVCTTDGNCSGLSGAVSSAGGTIGRIPKFTGSQAVGDSILSESSTVVTVNGGSLVIQGSAGLTLGTASTANGKIDFKNSTNGNTFTLQSGATSSNFTLTLPSGDGTSNQCIKTNGSGVLTFGDCLTGSGGGGGVTALNGNSGSVTIQGTANQVSVTGNGVNPIVLSLPQNIATNSTPTFSTLNLSGTVSAGLKVGTTGTGGRVSISDGDATEQTATFITSTLSGDKVITIPNFAGSSATLPVTASGFIAIDGAGNIATTGTLPVASGGTGSSSAAGARSNLGAAASGSNADITSTTALNTITPSGTLTVGAAGQTFTLQGSASSSLKVTDTGITNTLAFATPSGINKTITVPNISGTICLDSGNCLGGASGGANASLSNLTSVAINTSLLAGATSIDLGSTSAPFRDLYLGGTATNNFKITGTATAARTITLPDASGVVAVSASGNIALSAAGNISLTGQVPVANGGTGASTAQNAINTLTGMTTNGDLLYHNGSNAVRLARGADTQCLVSTATTIQWATCTGDGVGVTLIGGIDTQTASANGAVISGTSLYLQTASPTAPGLVSTGSQTFAGSKTFSGAATFSTGLTVTTGQSVTVNGDIISDFTGTGLTISGGALQTTLGTSVDLTSEVNGILPIANGGTGAASSQAAINALSQLTTNGDLLYNNGTNSTRLARGTTGQCLLSTATTIQWNTCTGDGVGVTAVGTINSQTKSANGAVISGTTIYLQTADATNVGLVSTGSQTIAGFKTFSGGLTSPGSGGSDTIAIGSSAVASAISTIAIGNAASAVNNESIAIGISASATDARSVAIGGYTTAGNNSVAVGDQSNANVVNGTAIGFQAVAGNNDSIAIGSGATTNAGNQLVVGSSSVAMQNGYFGNGVTNATPTGFVLHATGGSGSNITGGGLTLAGGQGTGTGAGGSVYIQTAPASGSTGSSLNALVTRLEIQASGNILVGQSDATGTLLVVDTKTGSGDPTGVAGGMYYNSNLGKFRCYEAGAWKDCDTSGGVSAGVNTVGTIDGGTYSANGASISGTTIYLQAATATHVGLVNTTTQTFGGAKTFTDALQVGGASNTSQLVIQGNASQTLPSVLFQNSSGVEQSRISVDNNANQFFGANIYGYAGVSGTDNTGYGSYAARSLSTGSGNTAVGSGAIPFVTTGSSNTAVGTSAGGNAQTTANSNALFGYRAMYTNSGDGNSVFGAYALGGISNGTLSNNSVFGYSAGVALSTGSNNVLIGYQAGNSLTTGSNNIVLGYNLNVASGTGSNQLNIGGLLQSTDYVSGNLTIGASDTTGQLLVLDTKTGAGDPTGVAGGMYYNSNLGKFRCYQGGAWGDCAGSSTGATTIGTIDSQTKSANGAVISGASLYLQTADATAPGLVSTGTQTLAGSKTFTGATTLIKNTSDSTNAFAVQQAGSTNNVLQVDTTNSQTILRGPADTGSYGTELASNTFNTTWTGTGWTRGGSSATHTSGTTALIPSPSIAPVTGSYQINYTTSGVTAGSVTWAFSGSATYGTSTNGSYSQVVDIAGGGNLVFTPTTNFNGTISNVSIRKVTQIGAVLKVQNNSGSTGLEIRTSSDVRNLFIGNTSGQYNSGFNNTGVGTNALQSNTSGWYNTAFGASALQYNTTGTDNTAFGTSALLSSTTGVQNTGIGSQALLAITTGGANTGVGYNALNAVTTGSYNTGLGTGTLTSVTSGNTNVAVGYGAGRSITTGSSNSFIGDYAGGDDGAGWSSLGAISNSTGLGYHAQVLQSDSIVIGTSSNNNLKVAIGNSAPLNFFSAGAATMTNGTACLASTGTSCSGISGNQVFWSGGSFTSSMVGQQIVFNDGTTGIITAYTSATRVTLSVSAAMSSAINFRMYYQGLQVVNDGTVFTQGTNTSQFSVKNATGTNILAVDTTNNQTIFRGGVDTGSNGAELFTGSYAFTASTGWNTISGTGSSATATHASGTTNLAITPALNATSGAYYQVGFTVNNRTAGTITMNFGGQSTSTQASNDTFSQIIQTSSTGTVTFTPSTTFNGTVTNVTIKLVTSLGATLKVLNSNGFTSIEVRSSSDVSNTFIGSNSGQFHASNYTTAVGANALQYVTTGYSNSALGSGALMFTTTGYNNSAFGHAALQNNTTGAFNTAVGQLALNLNTSGGLNVAIGTSTLAQNTTGGENTAIGHGTLGSNTSGNYNTAVGRSAAGNNTTGSNNTAVGEYSLSQNTTGSFNSALGYIAGTSITTGVNNTTLGYRAGDNDGTFTTLGAVNNSTALGNGAQILQSDTIAIGMSGNNLLKVGIGSAAPLNFFTAAPYTTISGTACLASTGTSCSGISGNQVFWSGGSFNSSMVGQQIVFANGTTGIITAYTSATRVTVSVTAAMSSAINFRTYYQGLQVVNDGTVYSQGTNTSQFSVKNGAGTSILAVDTTNQQTIFRGPADTGSLGTELANNTFSTTWTGTNWTKTSSQATHTTGNTSTLSPTSSLATVSGSYYQVSFQITSASAGSLAWTLGGSAGSTQSTNDTFSQIIQSGGGNLVFTPTSTFNGIVSNVSVKLVTQIKAVLQVQNNSGSTVLEVRANSNPSNTFIGNSSGQYNSGFSNTGLGMSALANNTSGTYNTALGYISLQNNTTGSNNTAVGNWALQANTIGSGNTALGDSALELNTTGSNNVALGNYANSTNTSGSLNVTVGTNSSTTGTAGTALGAYSVANDHGIALGYGAQAINPSFGGLIAIGNNSSATGADSIALGTNAIASNTNSIAIGWSASSTGHSSIALGYSATTTADRQFVLGSDNFPTSNILDAYLGAGVTSANAATQGITLHATGGSGSNITGAGLTLAGGQGTGTGAGGNINLQVAAPSSTGSSLNSLSTVMVLNGSTGAATFTNAVNGANAFQIQNAAGAGILNVGTSTTASNLLNNASSEGTTGWQVRNVGGSPTVAVSSDYANFGNQSTKVVTSTTASNGAFYRYPFKASTQYSLSLTMRLDASSTNTVNIGYASTPYSTGTAGTGGVSSATLTGSGTTWTAAMVGSHITFADGSSRYITARSSNTSVTLNSAITLSAGTAYEINQITDCLTGQTVNTTWTTFNCTFTTGATVSQYGNFYVRQTDTTTDNIYIDGVMLVTGATASNYTNYQMAKGIQVDPSAGGTVTVLGGNSGEVGTWQSGSSLPTGIEAAVTVTANGYIYSIGGNSPTAGRIDVVNYAKLNADGSTGTWAATTSLPTGRSFAMGLAANGYVYVFGGGEGLGFPQSSIYYAKINTDGTLGSWQTEATNSMPAVRSSSAITYLNGYVYIIAGYEGTYQNTVYFARLNANGSIGTWTSTTIYGGGGLTETRAISANGYIYLLGGHTAGGPSDATVFYAKPNANGTITSWATGASLPAARAGGAVAVSNGYMYYIGGDFSGSTNTVYYTRLNNDGTYGAWSTAANSLPANRANIGSAVANGYIYAIGGYSGSTQTANNYYAKLGGTLQVAANLDLVGVQSGTLADAGGDSTGSVGGSITAGNGMFVGTFQVQGAASFNQAVSINATLSVNGDLAIGTADTTGNLLILDTKTGSGDPTGTDGAMYYNSNMKAFRCYTNGSWRSCMGGVVAANTTVPAGNTISSTASETNFASNYSIPANECQPGKVFRVTANGVFSTASNPALTIKLKFGTTSLYAAATGAAPNGVTNSAWRAEFEVTCDTAGGSGTVEAQGIVFVDGIADAHFVTGANTATKTIDTTTAQTLQLSTTWGTSSASNTITLRQLIVEAL